MHYHQFKSRCELIDQLALKIVAQLNDAIAERGRATMAVSGGNSPKPLFDCLSMQSIDWSKVTITLVDERWVDESHPDSNAKLVKDFLLQNKAATAQFVPLYNGAQSPFDAEIVVDNTLAKLSWPLDVVVLGMGEDGHTASFFPQAPTLSAALDLDNRRLCCAIEPVTAPYQRMTLTRSALLPSQHTHLLVTGHSKKPVLRQAMQGFPGNNEANNAKWIRVLPVRSMLQQSPNPVEIYYAD